MGTPSCSQPQPATDNGVRDEKVSAQILSLVLLDRVTLYSFLSMVQYLTPDIATRCHTGSHSMLSYLFVVQVPAQPSSFLKTDTTY